MPNTGPLPIVVATTGHIDLRPEDRAQLTVAVRQVLHDLQTTYPHTGVELWSSLAEGADRLVADVALDLGVRLVVPMPMEPEEYKKDFTDTASVQEFDALRARASRSFIVPDPAGGADHRPDCYARLGAYSVTHAHLVLALWNGVRTSKTGGTAQIVRYRLEGIPINYREFLRMLDPIETGVVCHIVTPRQADPRTEGERFASKLLAPERAGVATAEAVLQRMCQSTDAFNALASATVLEAPGLPNAGHDLEPIVTLFGYADQLAIRFQGQTRRVLTGLFLLAFAAVLGFELFHLAELPVFLGMYVIGLFAASRLYKWAASRELDSRYLDYRALAEALRVEFCWRVAGVGASAADYYMRNHIEDAEWIRFALRSCERDEARDRDADGGLGRVVKEWVEGQHGFFVRAVARDHKLETTFERLATVLWWMSALGAAALVGLFASEHYVPAIGEAVHPAMAMVGIFTAGFALTHGYLEKRALESHINRYTRMRNLYASALGSIREPLANGDTDRVRFVLRELGREALDENVDWVMLHRERPLEVPQ